MPYESIDALQKTLAETVFAHTTDKKKASGRALGTLVELITYYCLCAWDFRNWTAIERSVDEYAHPSISHNVEFSLHPLVSNGDVDLVDVKPPITDAKIGKATDLPGERKSQQVLTSKGVIRNCAIIARDDDSFVTANLESVVGTHATINISHLLINPFAIFECKRVGVEEGNKKGPQTIEKAKQGAYVARTVSSLQRVRGTDGTSLGFVKLGEKQPLVSDYERLRKEIVEGDDPELLRHFVLTVGVVSNHGNWFTSDSPHKELRVLANSYDWLLFLTDPGLAQFIDMLLLNPKTELEAARTAFLNSYAANKKENRFTKVKIDIEADKALKRYFDDHINDIESWFNVITPSGHTLSTLHEELNTLSRKNWKEIRAT